jgi:PKD repeat protein/photosystem II stability/assembly factor-like uncharacterized protein
MNFFYKRIYIVFFLIIALGTACEHINPKNNKFKSEEEEEGGIPLRDRMDLAWQQEKEMTQDPALGYVPTERLISAWEYTKRNIASRTNAAIANMSWVGLGPKNFGGRSRSICIDLNDATRKTVFVGSVGGGLWKTTDITQTEPNWQPVNEFFGNIAISSIAQDPSNTQNLYFSTGEGYGNSDATRGLGVWKSTDGGANWNQLSSTNNSSFYYCQKVFVTSTGIVFVSTRTGLYRSANSGTSFAKVLGTGLGISGATSDNSYDIEAAANGDLYSSLSGSLHKSTDGGITWSAALPIGIVASRIEIATAPSNANYVYIICESGSAVAGIALSTNAGASFTTKTEPVDADSGIPSTDFSRTQAWYDLTITVDPNNENNIFVGGVDLFKSANGGATWQQISHWYGGFTFQNVHADQHNIVFSPGSSTIAYFLNDGGIYRTTNANATIPTIVTKDANYNTLQFYACAMNPTAGSYEFVAGAQDNGSHKFTQSLVQNSTEVTGGDGAFCHIDQNQSQYWFTSYVYNNFYRSTDGGSNFTSVSSGNTGRFINPTDYDDNSNILYCAKGSNEYMRWDDAQTGSTFTTVALASLGAQVSAIKVSPNRANRVFFGTGTGGNIVRVDAANTATPTSTIISAGLPSAYVSCIEVETGNDNHILVTFSGFGINSIWETINGGTNWTSIEGNMPDMPVRWIIFNPNNNTQAVVATELGIWSTDNLNGTSTVWGASNNGLANVRVDMLQVRQSDKLMIAATHGRGLYYSGVFAPPTANFNMETQIIYPGRALQFTNTSLNATSYLWNFGDGNTSTLANPLKQYINPGTYNVSLSINGGASSTIKSVTVLPRKGTPYLIAIGGNFESNLGDFAAETISGTGWERGNSAITGKNGTNSGTNAWVTGITASSYVDNSVSYLYTPVYNFTNAGAYNFSFYTKYNCEPNYDGFRLEYSIDTGKVWLPLGTTVVANWYNFSNTTDVTAFTFGEAFFTGNFGSSFIKKNYDVSSLAGISNVAFRLAFKSDDGVVSAGIAIDDVELTGPSNISLPANLLSFTGSKQNRNTILQWSTSNEINVSYYSIERSWDGNNFSEVGKTLARNNVINNYSFEDKLENINRWPSNTVYYRLKIIDKNGTIKTSNILQLQWSDVQQVLLTVSPNPFNNYIQINTKTAIQYVQLIGLNGQIVFSSNAVSNERVNLSGGIVKGNYLLKVYTDKGVVVEKVIKQ